MAISPRASKLLNFAHMAGTKGYHVVGLPDQKAVNELLAEGLVSATANNSKVGYDARIFAAGKHDGELLTPLNEAARRNLAKHVCQIHTIRDGKTVCAYCGAEMEL